MALHNLARVSSSTTGTGTLTLGSAVSGFLTFADAGVTNGEVVTYAIRDGAASEIGQGTYTSSGTTLSRDTIFESTNGGSAIDCSGDQEVFITAAAETITYWDKILNESGASFASFTANGGTWASDSGVIKQTNTGVSSGYAYTADHPIVAAIIEAEVQMKTNGGRGGVMIGAGSGGITSAALIYIQPAADNIVAERAAVAAIKTVSVTINVDTWYKLRLIVFGDSSSYYLDGALIGTSGNHRETQLSKFALYAHQAEVWYRNIKGWVFAFPA